MKRLVILALLWLPIVNALSQGTVLFLNDTATLSTPPDRFIRFGWASGALSGTPAFGTNLQVQLYYGASTAPEAALIAVATAPARLRASTSTAIGTWSAGGMRTLDGFPFGSGTVNLQVRLWDITYGATYELALMNPNNSGPLAKSPVFQYLIPSSASAQSTDFAMKNFTGFSLEPFWGPEIPLIISQPQDQYVLPGETATFNVSAYSYSPLTYAWRFHGTNLPGATTYTLRITNVLLSHAGPYSVLVSNPYGSAPSRDATLTVVTFPLITAQPTNVTAAPGGTAIFRVVALGQNLTYQWRFNGTPLTDATNSIFTLINVQPAHAGIYSVTLSNSFGTTNSANASLAILDPYIVAQPTNQVVSAGASAYFLVIAGGTPPLSYQWRKNGSPIANATGSSLNFASVQLSDYGTYSVLVSNPVGSRISSDATLSEPRPATVFFVNDAVSLPAPPDRLIRFGVGAPSPGAPAWGTNLQVQLYYGASNATENALIAVTTSPARLRASTTSVPGTWSAGGDRTLNGFPFGSGYVKMQVRVWSIFDGATYEQALANPSATGLMGKSLPFLYLTPQAPDEPVVTFMMSNYTGFTVGLPSISWPPVIYQQPQPQFAIAGQTVTFSVGVAGAQPFAYFWRFNGTTIPGATSNSFTLTNVQASDLGGYSVLITNIFGAVTSSVAVLTFDIVAPTILTQPSNVAAIVGQNVSFTVGATGVPPPTYQWQFNGANLAGATNSVYSLANVQFSHAGNYRAFVSNQFGSVVSSNAALTVGGPPVITAHPTNVSSIPGGTATFVVAASGSSLAYQWKLNGTPLPDATNSSLTITNVQAANAGVYVATVSNAYGSVNSAGALLSLLTVPVITAHPTNVSSSAGGTVTFVVAASGPSLNYQWTFKGVTLAGGTSSLLTIPNVQLANVGTYAAIVSNLYGSVTSSSALLSLIDPMAGSVNFLNDTTTLPPPPDRLIRFGAGTGPLLGSPAFGTNLQVQLYYGASTATEGELVAVTTAPARLRASTSLAAGTWSAGGFRTLSGFGFGSGHVKLQVRVWDIIDGTTYEQAAANPQGTGWRAKSDPFLYLMPSGGFESSTSFRMANFTGFPVGPDTLPGAPVIYSPPQSQAVVRGQSVTFTVGVSGLSPFSYEWLFNGTPTTGANSNWFTITNAQEPHVGGYSVVVTNTAGAATSSVAALTFLVPPTIVTQPVSVVVAAGQSASFSVAAIGSAPLFYEWQVNGTHIFVTTSNYTISNVQTSHVGVYRVIVSNGAGSIVSSNATLSLPGPPIILAQPTNTTAGPGGTTSFQVTAVGPGPSYQWKFNGAPLANATNSALVLTNIQATNVGVYCILISNSYGTVTSSNALLSLVDPWIAGQPSNQVAALNGSATFTVQAQGTDPLRYQWRRNDNNIPGATNASFSLANVQLSDYGRYSVLVYNNSGSILSRDATLAITQNPAAVNFWNDTVTLPGPPDRTIRFLSATTPGNVFGTNMARAVGTNFLVQLYYGPTNAPENDLVPVSSAPARLRVTTTSVPGTWGLGGFRTLSAFGYGAGPVTLQVRVWNSLDGPTYEQAQMNNSMGVSGKSETFIYQIPPVASASGSFFSMSNFVGFTIDKPPPPSQAVGLFQLAAYTAGGGFLDLDPPGGYYASNTVVTVTATPAEGWTFLGWLGDANSRDRSMQLSLTRDKSVEAVFGTELHTIAGGPGSILVNPNSSFYPYGTVVRLTALPQAGNHFLSWGNAAQGDANPFDLAIIDPNPNVSAFFAGLSAGQATLAVTASGNGTVQINPAANVYSLGANVTLTAIPGAGQAFTGWSIDASGTQNPLLVTLNQSKWINANFTARPRLTADGWLDGLDDAGFRFTLHGDFGARYRIEASADGLSWTPRGIITNIYDPTQIIDPAATRKSMRFYRAVLLP